MSAAGQARVISRSRASAGSAEARMVATTSSTLETATARPQRMWARSRALRSSKAVRRATTSSRKAMKAVRKRAQVELLGPAAVQRQHVAAEAGLQRREAEELVQHHVGRGVAAQLDDDAHAEAVALVLDVGDALDLAVAGELGDALDHRRLVHLVGDLGDDDRGAGRRAPPRCGCAARMITEPRPSW